MVSIELIISISLLLAFSASFYYIANILRELNRVRVAQLRLDQIKFINNQDVDRALSEILWEWDWNDFDDYWVKYNPRVNPSLNVTRRIARNYYIALASMIRKGDLDIELLYELNPSGVTRYWEKMKPIVHEFRIRNNYPDYLEPVEYLAKRISELRISKGLPSPEEVTK